MPPAPAGLVSVVVLCEGQLEHTRLCVPSLLRHSRSPFELVFVDSGSVDGTAEYLAGIADAAPVRVEVARLPADAPFTDALAEGIRRARGDLIALVQNDVLVTDAWLDQLVALAGMAPAVGMAGPTSNHAPPGQRVDAVPYRLRRPKPPSGRAALDVDGLSRFAEGWRKEHKGQWLEVDHLGGFCVLLKRAVLEALGWFDPARRVEVADVEELSFRAGKAGFRLAVCRDLFVHNFASRRAYGPGQR